MNAYTPAELTKLLLLDYPNPQGLHPNEAEWRDLARKLKRERDALAKVVQRVSKALEPIELEMGQ